MEISKAALAVVAAVCIAAGAGAAYVATRSEAPAEAAAPVSDSVPAAAVDQSEGVIADEPPREPEPEPAVEQRAAPRLEPRRERTVARPPARRPVPGPAVESGAAAPAASEPRIEAPLTLAPPAIPDDPETRVPETIGPQYDELVVSADSVIGLQIESTVTSESARVEDEIVARVTRDVRVGDRVVIPAGSRAHGEVTLVERGGRLKDRARLGVRFTSIVLADGTRLPIETEAIYREGEAPGGESAAKIGGGAIGGAIIGGILGGAKGAAIGSAVGAGAGSGVVLAGGRNPATLSSGAPVTIRLETPVTVTVER
jgi:hypothetical protein